MTMTSWKRLAPVALAGVVFAVAAAARGRADPDQDRRLACR